jgi:single-strand DNA-binding protein
MSLNKAIFTGNLAKDAELKETGSGMAVLNFSVAVNDRRKQGEEWVDAVNWIDCVMFGNRATALAQYLTRGTKVAIESKIRWSSWETDEGQKRSKIDFIVDNLELLGGKREQSEPELSDDDIPW